MAKQTITLFLILALLSSILSFALTSSEQNYQSFGENTDDSKSKKTKSDSKSKKEDESKDKAKSKEKEKPNDDTKSKEDDTKSKDDDKTKENEDIKQDDPSSTSTPPSTTSSMPPTDDTSSTPLTQVTSENPSTTSASTTPANDLAIASTTPTTTTDPTQPSCDPTKSICPPLTDPTQSPCDPTKDKCPPVTDPTPPPCDLTVATCPPVINSNENTRCPADFRMDTDGLCHVISCTLPKDQCPPPCDVKKGECSTGIKCKPDYHRGADGFCHLVNCTLPKDQCPPPVCDLFTKICYWNEKCKTNSTESCEKHSKGSSSTDKVIKFYITNPITQQQVAQQPSNVLIPMDTLQFCNLIGDQACVFMNSNFKLLFNQTAKDNLGNWVLNGEAQNIGANPINNVLVVWHLYDAFGNIVGLTQGSPIPSSLGIGQITLFNLQLKPTDLTGVPKFYRISFVF